MSRAAAAAAEGAEDTEDIAWAAAAADTAVVTTLERMRNDQEPSIYQNMLQLFLFS